jgi:hypothetical protein
MESVDHLTTRLAEVVGNERKFTPYIQMHEFEALIYSNPRIIADHMGVPAAEGDVQDILRQYGGDPERIDDGPETAPSKRLMDISERHLRRSYHKGRDGIRLVGDIGLARLREACPRFDEWLKTLEAL